MITVHPIAVQMWEAGQTEWSYGWAYGYLNGFVNMFFRGVATQKELYVTVKELDACQAAYQALLNDGVSATAALELLAGAAPKTPAGSESPAGTGEPTPLP